MSQAVIPVREGSEALLDSSSDLQEWIRTSDESVNIPIHEKQPSPTQEEVDNKFYDTDLEIEVEEDKYYIKGEEIYLATCKSIGIVPTSYFIRHMYDPELSMRHHGLGPLGVKGISVPLITNTSVLKLDLQDNWLEALGAQYIAHMMNENCYITELDLSDNRLGSTGADYICDVIHGNSILKRLILSGNGFTDKDAAKFSKAIINNNTLSDLDLSRNEFEVAGGVAMGIAMGENETIEYLDLSWNRIRRRGAIALCDGIKVNPRLKRANLSWNGLGNEGALSVAEIFKCNDVLRELDISNNRITIEGVTIMSRGIEVNEAMKIFKVGQNPIGSAGALLLLKAVSDERNAIVELHLKDILVSKEFAAMAETLKQTRDIQILHGGILENYVIKGSQVKVLDIGDEGAALNKFDWNKDPVLTMKKYIENNNIGMADIFAIYDVDKNSKMEAAKLNAAFKKAGFRLSEEHTGILIDELSPSDGIINYSVFLT